MNFIARCSKPIIETIYSGEFKDAALQGTEKLFQSSHSNGDDVVKTSKFAYCTFPFAIL